MRIFWQSFIDAESNPDYMARLSAYLNQIAGADTQVTLRGISPPDRDFSRLSEFRCAIQAIDQAIDAEADGFDAVVLGHFQDPGLMELKSAIGIPVIGVGEASLHFAAQLGRQIGLITLDQTFRHLHHEQADRYGLGERVTHVSGLNVTPGYFADAFRGDGAAKDRMIAELRRIAQPMVDAGCDVIVPAGVLPGLLISGERGLCIGDAPVLNRVAVALLQAEMQARLFALNGLEPNRGPFCARAGAQAISDFRGLLARHSAGKD
ncbi:aspartate/glutamate racemase family protein [Paracoccus xiamenensis]|uniref:aspartate/glutamate racemase family protein n=1 Tax=Paracoccus xiamenensis TaxID=2714901 RepID=UPI00140C1899|nr:aspartate/glutamate racemase family protein [Paracoccus xiamenensis]NHF72859.1 hypothetical protein [Paracoccus xiamenensis]